MQTQRRLQRRVLLAGAVLALGGAAACDDDPAATLTPAERASAVRTLLEAGQASPDRVIRAGQQVRVVARVTDELAQPVEGAPVVWSGSGSVAADSAMTGALGVVRGTWTASTQAGIQEIVATVDGGFGVSDRTEVVVYPDTIVGTLVLTAGADSVRRGNSLEVVVTDARDRYGNVYLLGGAQPSAPPPIEFTSLDPAVATLTATRARSAVVTGLSVGTARIVSRSDGKADTVSVRVTN